MTRFALIVLAVFVRLPSLAAADTFTNPVGEKPIVIGDPFVLQHNGSYYLFGTNAPDGFRYSASKDLVHWTDGGYAWRREADSWSDPPYWAPEVKYYRGKFYMTYSGRVRGSKPARLLTALAVSDHPEGPYKDLYGPWFDPGYSVIDADILVDTDGTPYLYFSRNGGQQGYSYGAIYGVELTRDLAKPVSEPVKLLEASQQWERINWATNRCNEGPTVIRHNGKYLMTYSANNTSLPGYGIGVAMADKPLGPWVKDEKNPILASHLDIGVSSPGHNSITHSPDGKEMFIVYHSHADPTKPSQARVMNIDRMVFEGDGLRVLGPTRTPQPMPSGAAQH